MNKRPNEGARSTARASGQARNWATLTPPGLQQITAFRGFANHSHIHLQGRVRAVGRDTLASSCTATTDAPERRVTLQVGRRSATTSLTRLGYYAATVPVCPDLITAPGWHNVLVIADTGHGALTAQHRILLPQERPALLVICDLDGLLLPLRQSPDAPTTPDRDALIGLGRALSGGHTAGTARPAFYVSAHTWDRYPACCQSLADAGLAEAPILFHPAPSRCTTMDYDASKSRHVQNILATYPLSPAVLLTSVGALAQPALAEIVVTNPERFAAVYALESGSASDADRLANLRATCPQLVHADHPGAAAMHAVRNGLIESKERVAAMLSPPPGKSPS